MQEDTISYDEYEDNYNPHIIEEKPKKNKIIIIVITLILLLLLVLGIFLFIKLKTKNTDPPITNEIKAMYIEDTEVTLIVGESKIINVIIDAERPAEIPITWSSSDNNVATVSNGQITAVSEGTTVIKAYHVDANNQEFNVECKVIVTKKNTPSNNVKPTDKTKPGCTFSGPVATSIKVGGTTTYTLTCTDASNSFKDSTINKADFIYSTSDIISINLSKTNTTNGFKYTITTTGAKAGSTTLSLKAGVISDASGNTNNSITSNKITVTADTATPKPTPTTDTTKPSCTFSGPVATSIKVGGTTTYTLTCTDDSNNFRDSTIDKADFTYSTNDIISISLAKTSVTNGFKYTITTTGAKAGSTTLSLKAGVISDASGNTNNLIASNKITVTSNDTTKPSCTITGPTKTAIAPNTTTTFTIICTDDSNNFRDSTIDKTDFTYSTSGIVSISLSKASVTNGFKYTITTTGAKAGSTTLSLKAGVISDASGNTNNAITSSSIKVQTCRWVQTSHTGTSSCTSIAKPSNPVDGSTYVTCANSNNSNYKFWKGIYTYTCS